MIVAFRSISRGVKVQSLKTLDAWTLLVCRLGHEGFEPSSLTSCVPRSYLSVTSQTSSNRILVSKVHASCSIRRSALAAMLMAHKSSGGGTGFNAPYWVLALRQFKEPSAFFGRKGINPFSLILSWKETYVNSKIAMQVSVTDASSQLCISFGSVLCAILTPASFHQRTVSGALRLKGVCAFAG